MTSHDSSERCIECATDEEIATAWAQSGPHPTIRFDGVTCPYTKETK